MNCVFMLLYVQHVLIVVFKMFCAYIVNNLKCLYIPYRCCYSRQMKCLGFLWCMNFSSGNFAMLSRCLNMLSYCVYEKVVFCMISLLRFHYVYMQSVPHSWFSFYKIFKCCCITLKEVAR